MCSYREDFSFLFSFTRSVLIGNNYIFVFGCQAGYEA